MEDVDQLLPNELLSSGYTDEVVAMATAQQEKYKCILPKSHTTEEEQVCASSLCYVGSVLIRKVYNMNTYDL